MIAYEMALSLPPSGENSYALHQIIWQSLLQGRHIDYANSLLYRVLNSAREQMALLRMPAELFEQAGAKFPVNSVQCPITAEGQSFFFSVRLCPLYRSMRRLERTPADLNAWVTTLFSRNGLEVISASVGPLERACYEKPGAQKIAHNTRLFLVSARVTDVELAQHAWLYGVGRRKNTGCGLLLEMS